MDLLLNFFPSEFENFSILGMIIYKGANDRLGPFCYYDRNKWLKRGRFAQLFLASGRWPPEYRRFVEFLWRQGFRPRICYQEFYSSARNIEARFDCFPELKSMCLCRGRRFSRSISAAIFGIGRNLMGLRITFTRCIRQARIGTNQCLLSTARQTVSHLANFSANGSRKSGCKNPLK